MDPTRDLGQIDVRQKSLEDSLTRRGKLPRSLPKLYRLRAERDVSSVHSFEESLAYSRTPRRAAAKHSFVPVRAATLGGISAVVLLAVIALPSGLGGWDGIGGQVAFAATRMQDPPLLKRTAPASEYVNPLARASVTPERIDQGVDYAGTGTLTSIGWARVIYVGTTNTGWPGAFIEYRLLHGLHAGRYVYYAEGVTPARGIYVDRVMRPGRAVAYLIPGWSTGIEIGWAAGIGTETLAAKFGQYTFPTRCGENFSAFIASLGGPPGTG